MSAIDIARGLTQLRPDWNIDGPYQFGEIGAVGSHGTNTVDVYLDGSTSLSTGLHYLAGYAPQVNDPVMIGRMQGSSQSARVVLGPLAPGGTIHGGPPTSTPYAGARIFDTKYGVTWWWDGSAWHANGPGLIQSTATRNAAWTSGGVVGLDTSLHDLLGLFSPGTHLFTCPIPGTYRVGTCLQSSGGAIAFLQAFVLLNNGQSYEFSTASAPAGGYASSGGSVWVAGCGAGTTLGIYLGSSSGLTMDIGLPCCWAQFEFVSS
jgi:hypothetical protein